MQRHACPALEGSLRLLLEHTDVCTSVLACDSESSAAIQREAQGCGHAPPGVVQRVQALFGNIRRTYAPLIMQHPSIPLDLRTLLVNGISQHAPQLDIVISRCREPLWPALRVFPAALPPSVRARLRVVVYEHCAPGAHLQALPSLDVRDHMLSVHRITWRSGEQGAGRMANSTSAAAAAFAGYLQGMGVGLPSGSGARAERSIFLLPAGIHVLASLHLSQSRPEHRRSRPAGSGDPALASQLRMQRDLREQWSRIVAPVDSWTTSSGAAATVSSCLGKALLRVGAQAEGGSAALALHRAEDPLPLAIVAARGTWSDSLQRGASSPGVAAADGAAAWRSLLARASRFECAPRRPPASKLCAGYGPALASRRQAPVPRLAAAALGSSGASRAAATGVTDWPHNVSLTGFCGVTNEGVEGSCDRGHSGSWNTRAHRVRSFADCVGRCLLCARCAYVTYSPDNDDCSWYARRACNLRALGKDEAFQTVMVAPTAGGGSGGAAGKLQPRGSTAGVVGLPGMVAGDPRTHAAYIEYLCALRADRKWGRDLLRGALLLLMDAAARERRVGEEGVPAAAPTAVTTAPSGRAWLVDPACVAGDFMLHNRQLLPLPAAASAGASHAAASSAHHPCLRAGGLRASGVGAGAMAQQHEGQQQQSPPPLATGYSQHASGGVRGGDDDNAPLMSHQEAESALAGLIRSANTRASALRCAGEHSVRMELHLSGFFSMISSMLKPWTAALRMGRAFLTPTAPGLFDPRRCPRSGLGGLVEWSCHFERLGPRACEPATVRHPRVLFNLPEQHREALSDTHSLPAAFRHLGSFWWVSQLTRRLLRPQRHGALRTMLRAAARESGLTAALSGGGGPVIGMHVRHGDACLTSETSRTARSCEPLSAYMAAIQAYAAAVGATTVLLATDSERVLADARHLFPRFSFLHVPNVTRTGLARRAPTEVLDEVIKRRARTGVGVAQTEHDALTAAVDALLLSRCDILVGKFSSGLFRAAYALAAARRAGGLPPFVSLDAPWCADYAVPAGFNDNFPRREREGRDALWEQIDPDGGTKRGGRGTMGRSEQNVFLC